MNQALKQSVSNRGSVEFAMPATVLLLFVAVVSFFVLGQPVAHANPNDYRVQRQERTDSAQARAAEDLSRSILMQEVRAKLAEIRVLSMRARSAKDPRRAAAAQERIWRLSEEIERALTRDVPRRRRTRDRGDTPPPRGDEPPSRGDDEPPSRDDPPVDPPPVDPPSGGEDWPTIGTVFHNQWGFVENLAHETLVGIEWGAIGNPDPTKMSHAVLNMPVGKVHEGVNFHNCRFAALPHPETGISNERWCVRAFDADVSFRECEFIGSAREHHAYINPWATILFKKCRFEGAWAAAIQVAFRHNDKNKETINPFRVFDETEHIYTECDFVHIGNPGSERWGAFTLSEHNAEVLFKKGTPIPPKYLPNFDPSAVSADGLSLAGDVWVTRLNANVLLDRCNFIGGHLQHTDGAGNFVDSGRAFLVNNRPSATFLDTRVLYPNPDYDWAGQFRDVDVVYVDGCEFVAGRIEIKNPKKVTLVNNTGGATVRVGRGVPGVEGLDEVLYEGPISDDWSWEE